MVRDEAAGDGFKFSFIVLSLLYLQYNMGRWCLQVVWGTLDILLTFAHDFKGFWVCPHFVARLCANDKDASQNHTNLNQQPEAMVAVVSQ